MDEITTLQMRYAQLVAEYGLAIPRYEPNTPWSVDHAQRVKEGLAKDSMMHHIRDIFAQEFTGPWLQELTEEIEQAIQPWYSKDTAVFAGEFPTGSLNAEVCIFPEGYLILINDPLKG